MPGIRNAMAAKAYLARPDDVPAFWQLGNLWRVMASGVKTANSFCLLDQLVTPKGGGPCTHAHPTDEGLYVVSGHCTFQAAGQVIPAGPGEFIAVPRFAQHSFVVDAPGTQLLNFYLPSGFELFVMGFAHPAERNELPPPGIAPAPRRLIEQLSRDYGQIPVLGLPGADPPGPDNMTTQPTPGAAVFPFSRHADTAPCYWAHDGMWTVLADGAATDGSYSLFERVLRQGSGETPHVHVGTDEVFYMLDGVIEVLLGDHIATAGKGDLIFIPRGEVHGFAVRSATCRLLNLYTPSGFERTLLEFGAPTDAREPPPLGWTPPDFSIDHRNRVFADLGLRSVAVADPLQQQETRLI